MEDDPAVEAIEMHGSYGLVPVQRDDVVRLRSVMWGRPRFVRPDSATCPPEIPLLGMTSVTAHPPGSERWPLGRPDLPPPTTTTGDARTCVPPCGGGVVHAVAFKIAQS